jgi:hypothetical protein
MIREPTSTVSHPVDKQTVIGVADMGSPVRPNLFIFGAMKSGTTSLHAYLALHPDIFMSEPKEPSYFVEEMKLGKGEQWYLSLFAAAGDAKVIGESSAPYSMVPRYMGVPDRIARFNPDARFVYIMRDPFQRTLSHYAHIVRFHGERRDLLTAVRNHPPYINVSNYAMQLRPYFDTFGRDRVYTLTFEELVRHPRDAVGPLLAWLGLGTRFEMSEQLPKENTTPKGMLPQHGMLRRVIDSAVWRAGSRIAPRWLKARVRRSLERPTEADPELVAETRRYLGPIQSKQVEELGELLGRDFPEWTSFDEKPCVRVTS